MERNYDEAVERVADRLAASRKILFITGAGISAESGLPTYRGVGGLYENCLTEENLPIELALSGTMMRRDPRVPWTYISQIEKACRGATHNRAHQIIAEMESVFERVCVLTQNVDGFHHQAGSSNVIEIHGNLHTVYCPQCAYRREEVDYALLSIPPLCPECRQIMRPDVVLFGEALDPAKVSRFSQQWRERFDMVFTVGTSSGFPYISGPVYQALRQGLTTVEINPGRTEVTDVVSVKFSEGVVKVLSDIWARLSPLRLS